jgi:hypothetical protein
MHQSASAARHAAVWSVSFACVSSCKYTCEGRAMQRVCCSGLQVTLQQQMHTHDCSCDQACVVYTTASREAEVGLVCRTFEGTYTCLSAWL